ncbi:MAG: hypothetical protein H6711_22125 [Myxococcales bacterium]|nr:hypothetical protein [Myxococcales bacterium]
MIMTRARATALTALVGAGLLSSGCKEDPVPETHGFTCVEVRPGNAAGSDVAALFGGTTEIRVTVSYLDCLQDFYVNTNTAYAQDGVDGAPIFEEWADRLCEEDISGRLECMVNSINQTLSTMVFNMTVSYTGIDPLKIEGRKILIGPLPLESLAMCKPDVRLIGNNAVSGYDADGALLWSIESFEVNQGRADLDGRGCMTVSAVRK